MIDYIKDAQKVILACIELSPVESRRIKSTFSIDEAMNNFTLCKPNWYLTLKPHDHWSWRNTANGQHILDNWRDWQSHFSQFFENIQESRAIVAFYKILRGLDKMFHSTTWNHPKTGKLHNISLCFSLNNNTTYLQVVGWFKWEPISVTHCTVLCFPMYVTSILFLLYSDLRVHLIRASKKALTCWIGSKFFSLILCSHLSWIQYSV